jgi:nucleoside phosphorylase/predicted ATPase
MSVKNHKAQEVPVAVILTAISEEVDAVLAHLANRREYVHRHRFIFEVGLFVSETTVWRVAVAECSAGNVQAALHLDNAIDCFNPDVVLFVGVGGGIKDVALGDVVASSKIYRFHSGKAGERFLPRPLLENPDLALEQRAKAVRRNGAWPKRIQCERGKNDPRAFVGPIAAGENVVASEHSEAYRFLKDNYSDALAVEMEGYGFLSAARFGSCPGLVVRGISDLCEGKSKSDGEGWQPRAAAHAAAFAFELLATHSPPPRLKPQRDSISPWEDDVSDSTPSGQHTDDAIATKSQESLHSRANDILARLSKVSSLLETQSIDGSVWIPRPEEQDLRHLFSDNCGRSVCLLGAPGSGKTSILAKLAKDAIDTEYAVVAIKADLIPAEESFDQWSKHTLGLQIPLSEAIKIIAAERRVVVIVDQLDALASLVDLTSDRLNELIAFIRNCASHPNVAVLCSCREFEYRHDTRLSSINAECVTLQLPSWDRIAAELKSVGIENAEQWPQSFREILRTPQHLSIYLKRFEETGRQNAFHSYQTMLDDLWDRKLKTPMDKEFIYRLTEYMVENETLWSPMVMWEADGDIIARLESENVILRQGRQLGFRHQTLLEHAKARLFTKSGQSLAQHVLARQDAILVRPTLWTVLGYLRDANRDKYHEELDALFAADLRLHIRFLLIDFLGQVIEPDEHEVVQLTGQLSHSDGQLRTLLAIRGNERWFRALRHSHFPVIMRGPADSQWPMIGVISDALSFAREDCLALLSQYWLGDSTKDHLTYRVLQENNKWDQATVDMACTIIKRTDGDRLWWAEDLVSAVSADAPTLAPQVFLATVTRNDQYDTEEGVKSPRNSSRLLEDTNSWYELPAVAEAAPIEFARTVWPWFVKTVLKYHVSRASSVVNEYGGSLASISHEDDDIVAPVMAAITLALVQTAEHDPQAFIEIIQDAQSADHRAVHQLIARGFRAGAHHLADTALDYLISDNRRFLLGSYPSDNQDESIAMIAAIVGHLSLENREKLIQAILSWDGYRADVDKDSFHGEWNRKMRLRLLNAIPIQYLSESVSDFQAKERVLLPDWNRQIMRSRSGFVRRIPPMTKETMLASDDEKVLAAFRAPLPKRAAREWKEVEGGWEEPGGKEAASLELGELAKTNPDRVLPLLPKLIIQGDEAYVAQALHMLADSTLSDDRVLSLVRELAVLSPKSDELRSNSGYLLYRRCRGGAGLPDDLCDILAEWLEMPWGEGTIYKRSDEDELSEEEKREPTSVLWQSGGGLAHTDRSFWPLLAVTNGYLMRSPAETTKWLQLIDRLLDGSIDVSTWLHYCRELRWIRLKGCDRKHGFHLIRKLMGRFPRIIVRDQFVQLVARLADILPSSLLRAALKSLYASPRFRHRQAYGELLTKISLQSKQPHWSRDRLSLHLARLTLPMSAKSEAITTGIAFAAARLWDESRTRPAACDVLCRVIPHATKKIADAFGTVCWATDNFPADEHTDMLLRAIASSPGVLVGRFVSDLVEHLANLLPHSRHSILAVCKVLVDDRGNEIASLSNQLFQACPHLVNIAMTLQRFSDTRVEGLSLLEALLRLGLDDAFAILHDIDIRPGKGATAPTRTRRRRRRRTAA